MGERILLVDDNLDFLDSTKDVLEDEGYDVVIATDGEKALRLTQKQHFSLILMDIVMPGLNGLEVYRMVKESQPDTVAIVITGYAREMESMIRETLEESVHLCLTKPVEMGMLLGTIKDILRSKRNGTYSEK